MHSSHIVMRKRKKTSGFNGIISINRINWAGVSSNIGKHQQLLDLASCNRGIFSGGRRDWGSVVILTKKENV